MKIGPGEIAIVILRDPRERMLGVIHGVEPSGVFLRAIDLGYFDEWIKAVKSGDPALPMQDAFYPMWRVERILRDESSEGMPSMALQFEQRTGLNIGDF